MNIYTFVPSGNVKYSSDILGLGEMLLRVAESDRALMDLPFFSKNMVVDNGLTKILVMASRDHNSRIDIYSEMPAGEEEPPDDYRQRMLHCKIVLTLSADLDEDVDPDDGSVGWPYQKDPSFITVEPIPVMEGDDNKVYIHTFFEVDSKRGLVVVGINGEEHIDDTVDDWEDAKKGDEGRRLSLEDVKEIIEMQTDYRLVDKVIDDTGNVVPVMVRTDTIVPEDDEPTEFKDLMHSSFMSHYTEDKTLEGYEYTSRFQGYLDMMSNAAWHLREPVETYKSPFIMDDYENETLGAFHLMSSITGYIDTIEEEVGGDNPSTPQNEGNIHPAGNVNNEKLRHCYGTTCYFAAPFNTLISDFTPRTNDKVFIGDVGIASTRKKALWYEIYKDGEWEKVFPDTKLIAVVMPYFIEAKAAEDIAAEFEELEVDWNFYSRNPTKFVISGPPRDDDGDPLPPDADFYVPWSANWLTHPFRNDAWGTYLRDFYSMAEGVAEIAANPFFAHTEMMVNPEYAYADVPNRMILCTRCFFANTDNATSFAGVRRSYDIEFPSVHYDGDATNGNRPGEFNLPGTYDEIPTETSAPLSINGSPHFVTIKGDIVFVNVLSSIYAVSDYPAVTDDMIKLSPRHGGIDLIEDSATPVDTITAKRPWPAVLDGDWGYTNIYGAGITVDTLGRQKKRYAKYSIEDDDLPKRMINFDHPWRFVERLTRGESIYSDSDEDISHRHIEDTELMEDVTWREEDTPESHLIHCIYRALEKEGYDMHRPICGIEIEAELYDKYTSYDGET